MIQYIPVPEGAEVVVSQGDHGFQKVLTELPNAPKVWILTYSISTAWKNPLLDQLGQLDPRTEVLLISNIPSAFVRTKKTIEDYVRLLSPSRFKAKIQTFYSFTNHSKVVATEDIMYLGSGNFSVGGNLECGLLIRGRQIVERTLQMIVPLALNGSRPHPKTHKEVVGLWMTGVGADLRRHLATIREIFGSITDKLTAPATNLLADPPRVLAAHDEFAEVFGGIVADAAEQASHLPALGIPVARLREVHRLLSLDVVRQYLGHDRQDFVEKYVSNHPGPNIEAVQNDAFGYEDDFRDQLSRAARSWLPELEDAIQALLGDLERVCGIVESLGSPPGDSDVVKPR